MTAQNEEAGDDMIKPRIGSSLDELLREEGVLESATTTAITRVTAWQAGRAKREAELAALKQAGHALDEQLASRGVDPEAVVAGFEQARKAGRVQPGDPHDKKTR